MTDDDDDDDDDDGDDDDDDRWSMLDDRWWMIAEATKTAGKAKKAMKAMKARLKTDWLLVDAENQQKRGIDYRTDDKPGM